jgi:putative tricarboxylic transport membrane protein
MHFVNRPGIRGREYRMKSKDRLSGLVLIVFSGLVSAGALRYYLGTPNEPGPGMFPFLLGFVIAFLSLIVLFGAKRDSSRRKCQHNSVSEIGKKRRVWGIIIALAFYGFFLEILGFVLCTFILFGFLLGFISLQKWYVAIGGALLGSLGSYAVFKLLLQVQLPRGVLGI